MPEQPAIYLDYAAATPLDTSVFAAMQPYLSEVFYNPSATYVRSRQAKATLDTARSQVARQLGARPSEIIFTAGGTESDNVAIHGVMRQFPGSTLVVSSIEHEAVLAPAAYYDNRQIAVLADGRIDLTDLESKIDDQTVLVSVMQANNEVGTIQPIRDVSHMIQTVRKDRQKRGITLPLYFHSDACQAANYLDLHVSRLGVDLLTLNGGKIYGPKQSGILYVKGGIELRPLIDGGGQERGLRSGTENIAAAVGFAVALDQAQAKRHEETSRLQSLQKQFIPEVQAALPNVVINGSLQHRLANNVHLTLPGSDNERLLFALDEAGIMAAAGSACSASNDTPSHVLRAMGISDANARASLRFTMGRDTTADMIKKTVQTLTHIA